MVKTSKKYCRKCRYSWKQSNTDIICGYIIETKMSRGANGCKTPWKYAKLAKSEE